MWDPVPWFVAGGKHGPEVARLLAFAATGGGEGVVQAADAKVQQLAVPDDAIRVMPGAVVIRKRAAGAGAQSYLARNPQEEEVTLTATGSGGARSDLIIARVEDPEDPGWAVPVDPLVGPYVFTRVIEDVPVGTTRVQQLAGHENDSAVTLARVTRPASTGTVTNAHITDLRELSVPRAKHEVRISNPAAPDLQDTTDVAGEVWPNESSWTITVPEWATKVRIIGTWAQVKAPPGDTLGWLWVVLGDGSATPAPTQKVRYDNPNSATPARETYVCADEIDVPAALRGSTVNLRMRAYKSGGSDAGRLIADTASATAVTLDFIEAPV